MSAHPESITPLFGQCVIPGNLASALPLQKTDVSCQITGPVAVVAVTQHFTNPISEPIELEYIFPLPHKAALVDFEISIGARTLRGDLQEIKNAQESYEKARQSGHQAGILEQRRPNLFAIKIANVRPAEDIHAILRYQESLNFNNSEYEFVFPMGITPKYHSPEHPEEQSGVNPPVANAEEIIGPVEIILFADAGVPVRDPISPSHPLSITRLDAQRFTAQLASSTIPDHDFILRYATEQKQPTVAAWRTPGNNGDYFFATLVPSTPEEDQPDPAPREFVFVFDRSGSMSGEPIAQARNALQACLRILNPNDTFYILFFDNQIEWFCKSSSRVTQDSIDSADRYLAGISGRGGTEILQALNEALALPQDADKRTRYIVFLTDGAVSAEERLLNHLRRRLTNERIFTFGIGPSVNRALLNELSHLGRGMSEYLQLDEDIEGAIMRFQDRVSYPLLTDITINFENCKTWDVFPSRPPDLYAGQPIDLCGRLKLTGKKAPVIQFKAYRGGEEINYRVGFSTLSTSLAIQRSWARAKLDDLLEQLSNQPGNSRKRDEIISHALEHHLVTPYTAFVALDSETVLQPGQKTTFIQIAQPLPAGLDPAGFGLQPPQVMRMMAAPPPTSPDHFTTMLAEASPQMYSQKFSGKSRPQGRVDASIAPSPATSDQTLSPADTLRLLARTQNLNGSWNNDLETTSAAVLAFVRQNHSPANGLYRRHLSKAVEWLLAQTPTLKFPDFVRALALSELATLLSTPKTTQAAKNSLDSLPQAGTKLDEAALRAIQSIPLSQSKMEISSLDDLRIAGMCRIQVTQPINLPNNTPALLVQVWLACV